MYYPDNEIVKDLIIGIREPSDLNGILRCMKYYSQFMDLIENHIIINRTLGIIIKFLVGNLEIFNDSHQEKIIILMNEFKYDPSLPYMQNIDITELSLDLIVSMLETIAIQLQITEIN